MIFERIRDIIAEQLGMDPDDITLETNLAKDLDADSLDIVETIMAIEEEYGIDIPDEQVEEFSIVENLVKYVEENAE